MSIAARPLFAFESTFVDALEGLYEPWTGDAGSRSRACWRSTSRSPRSSAPIPRRCAAPTASRCSPATRRPPAPRTVAQAYAGHQFGDLQPRLGDGRALLLGEVVDVNGRRRDLHLKGSGRTPFARGGDGKAAVGPMLREYVIGEAMHALGIPTTRALAVVATGEEVVRETLLPGAVLTRVAASHIRVGTFQYAASAGRPGARPAPRRLRDRPPPPGRGRGGAARTSRSSRACSTRRRRSSRAGWASGSSTAS